MLNFIALAHEEGVSTGPDAWLGPVLFFAIIFLAVVVGKVIARRRRSDGGYEEVTQKDD